MCIYIRCKVKLRSHESRGMFSDLVNVKYSDFSAMNFLSLKRQPKHVPLITVDITGVLISS